MKDRSAHMESRKRLFAYGKYLRDLKDLVERACKVYGDTDIIRELRGSEVVSHTYFELKNDINAIGTALIDMGFSKKHIAILGESSYRWIVTDMAVSSGVGVIVPLDKELQAKGLANIINKSDAEIVFCSKAYLNNIKEAKELCPSVHTYIILDSEAEEGFLSLDDIIAKGRELIAGGNTEYWDKELDADEVCVILYTSGTTGPNKGVMLTQKNICANIDNAAYSTPAGTECLAMLPINHAFEFNCTILSNIYFGVKICILPGLKDLMRALQIYRPDEVCAVPVFLEMIYKGIWDYAKAQGKTEELKQKIAESKALLEQGIDKTDEMFAEQKALFGGRLSLIVCGGAPLNPGVASQLNYMGIDITNGYGITECSPVVAVNIQTDKDPYSVGLPSPGNTVRIGEPDADGEGEILVSGDVVMKGYYKDKEATKASFTEDGFFRTGDYGKLTEDGRLIITGRKKNLIILANGKNVHPEELEQEMALRMPLARECVVYAAKNNTLGSETEMINIAIFIDGITDEIKEQVISAIKEMNCELPVYKRIGCVVFRDRDFERTTTKKVVRTKVIDAHNPETGIIL